MWERKIKGHEWDRKVWERERDRENRKNKETKNLDKTTT